MSENLAQYFPKYLPILNRRTFYLALSKTGNHPVTLWRLPVSVLTEQGNTYIKVCEPVLSKECAKHEKQL